MHNFGSAIEKSHNTQREVLFMPEFKTSNAALFDSRMKIQKNKIYDRNNY